MVVGISLRRGSFVCRQPPLRVISGKWKVRMCPSAFYSADIRACVFFHRRKSGGFSKRNSDRVAFRKRSKPAAIARVRGFGHDLPTIAQHARKVLIHRLHARQQPLPIVFPRPISLVCKGFHFHLRHHGRISQLPSLLKRWASMKAQKLLPVL